jgi:hypothetical protein
MSISKINGETIIAAFGGGYSLRGTLASATNNPSAGTTYFGGGPLNTAITTTAGVRRLYIPKTGTIKSCYGYFNQTASASGNTGTLNIRLNDTTDTLVGTAAHNVVSTVYSNTGLSIAVTQGNYIEFKWTCPATTAPTSILSSFIIYIE